MINKIIRKTKEKGILYIFRAFFFRFESLFKIFFLRFSVNYKNFIKSIENYNRFIVFENYFGYNKILMQRPQHMAKSLADENTLFIYSSGHPEDFSKNKLINSITNNLIVINIFVCRRHIINLLNKNNIVKYLMIYSTDNTDLNLIKRYKEHGFKIIYEYVDDISAELIDKEIFDSVKEKHEYALENADIIVCTAKKLYDNAKAVTSNTVLISNGVDYDHFANPAKCTLSDEYQRIINEGKPIIGYYGAFASWFDYDILKYLAKNRPDYNIVLFGIQYDESYKKSGLDKFSNIHYLGKISYANLPCYASYFSVCTIPFVINEITKSTSPVKLFEYMAMGKPIVTTDMIECRNYKSVMIADNADSFIKLIDKGVVLNNDNNNEYFDILREEALNNTWGKKAEELKKIL